MKTLRTIFDQYGLKPTALSRLTGLPRVTCASHYYGSRNVSAEAAVTYDEKAGIPRWELRPDLWEAPAATAPKMNATADTKEAADAEAKETNE